MDPPYTFAGHIAKGGKLSDFATELKLTTVMSDVFTEPPMRGYLYIIVDILDLGKCLDCWLHSCLDPLLHRISFYNLVQTRTSVPTRLIPLPALSTCAPILTLSLTKRSFVPLVGRITILRRALKSDRTAASYAPREATVSGIYAKLQHHKYIQVCSRLSSRTYLTRSRFEAPQAAGKQPWPDFFGRTYCSRSPMHR